MAAEFVYRYIPVGNFIGRTRPQTRGDIIRGINAYKNQVVRKLYRIDMRSRHSNVEGVRINVQPVVIGGQHYAGMATKGQIYLHSGLEWSPLALGMIALHEFLHTRGVNHNVDPNDLMHPNGSYRLTHSAAWFRRMFGSIKPRSQRESAEEVVAMLSGRRDGCPVGAFNPRMDQE